jgi:hypothetical protein
VLLRVFTVGFHLCGIRHRTEWYLPFITTLSSQSPSLEYFGIIALNFGGSKPTKNKYYGKRDRHGEWVLCDKGEFPSVLRVCLHSLVQRIEYVLTIHCLDVWMLLIYDERCKGAIYSACRIVNIRRLPGLLFLLAGYLIVT